MGTSGMNLSEGMFKSEIHEDITTITLTLTLSVEYSVIY